MVSIIIGPLELFAGEKLFGVTVFILGFIASFIVAMGLSFIFFLSVQSSWTQIYIFMIISAIFGVLFGGLLAKLRQIGIVASGTIGGFFLGVFIHTSFLGTVQAKPSQVSLKALSLQYPSDILDPWVYFELRVQKRNCDFGH